MFKLTYEQPDTVWRSSPIEYKHYCSPKILINFSLFAHKMIEHFLWLKTAILLVMLGILNATLGKTSHVHVRRTMFNIPKITSKIAVFASDIRESNKLNDLILRNDMPSGDSHRILTNNNNHATDSIPINNKQFFNEFRKYLCVSHQYDHWLFGTDHSVTLILESETRIKKWKCINLLVNWTKATMQMQEGEAKTKAKPERIWIEKGKMRRKKEKKKKIGSLWSWRSQ